MGKTTIPPPNFLRSLPRNLVHRAEDRRSLPGQDCPLYARVAGQPEREIMGSSILRGEQDSEAVKGKETTPVSVSCQRRIAIPLIAPIKPNPDGIFVVSRT